jgi:hypothetical protein
LAGFPLTDMKGKRAGAGERTGLTERAKKMRLSRLTRPKLVVTRLTGP